MKQSQIKINRIANTNIADDLIETFLGKKTPKLEKNLASKINETYKLPVQVGQTGKALSKGDKPWIVGYFSPNAPTDKNHKFHNGVDLKAPKGTPIYPIASGIVKDIGVGNISGNYVTCLHENGSVQSFYGHLDSIKVRKGQEVNQHTVIGTVGDTGNAKGRGAHLHYEVKVNGMLINPLGIAGKPLGFLSKKAELFSQIKKISNEFEILNNLFK